MADHKKRRSSKNTTRKFFKDLGFPTADQTAAEDCDASNIDNRTTTNAVTKKRVSFGRHVTILQQGNNRRTSSAAAGCSYFKMPSPTPTPSPLPPDFFDKTFDVFDNQGKRVRSQAIDEVAPDDPNLTKTSNDRKCDVVEALELRLSLEEEEEVVSLDSMSDADAEEDIGSESSKESDQATRQFGTPTVNLNFEEEEEANSPDQALTYVIPKANTPDPDPTAGGNNTENHIPHSSRTTNTPDHFTYVINKAVSCANTPDPAVVSTNTADDIQNCTPSRIRPFTITTIPDSVAAMQDMPKHVHSTYPEDHTNQHYTPFRPATARALVEDDIPAFTHQNQVASASAGSSQYCHTLLEDITMHPKRSDGQFGASLLLSLSSPFNNSQKMETTAMDAANSGMASETKMEMEGTEAEGMEMANAEEENEEMEKEDTGEEEEEQTDERTGTGEVLQLELTDSERTHTARTAEMEKTQDELEREAAEEAELEKAENEMHVRLVDYNKRMEEFNANEDKKMGMLEELLEFRLNGIKKRKMLEEKLAEIVRKGID